VNHRKFKNDNHDCFFLGSSGKGDCGGVLKGVYVSFAPASSQVFAFDRGAGGLIINVSFTISEFSIYLLKYIEICI